MSFRASLATAVATILFTSSSSLVNAAAAAPSAAQIAEIVYWHNAARAEIARSGNCANMLYANWDTSVAAAAESNVCPTSHNGVAAATFGSDLGEDLAWASGGSCTTGLCAAAGNCGGTGQPACESGCGSTTAAASSYCTIKSMVYDGWYQSESTNKYTIPNNCLAYNSNGGHCSQVNWQSSTGIGCAYQTGCSSWDYTLNCNYNPAGNFNIPDYNTVYLACTAGTACSACPTDYPNCISSGVFQGLCSKTATATTTAASSTATTAAAVATTAASVATTAAATTVTATTAPATTAKATTAKATTAATATTAKPTTAKATTAAATATTVKPTSTSTTAAASASTAAPTTSTPTTSTPTTSTATTSSTITVVITLNGDYPVNNPTWDQAFLSLVDDITGTTDAVTIASASESSSKSTITLSITDSASTGLTASQIAAIIIDSTKSSSSSSTTATKSLSSTYPGVTATEGSASSDSSSSSGLSTTIIAIIAAVGGAVVLVSLVAAAYWIAKRREKVDTSKTANRLQTMQMSQI